MPMAGLEGAAVRRQMERVLESAGFVRNERLSRFLRFVVERHLAGRDLELKESVIGVEVFGRNPGYNPQHDPIVRTEARRLRARLDDYYQGAGSDVAVVIELPKGGYQPVVRFVAAEPPDPAATPVSWRRRSRLALLGFACFLGLLAIVSIRPRLAPRATRTQSPAYDLYLRAHAAEQRPGLSGVEENVDTFEQAIAKDPSFAPAYAGLATAEAYRSGFDRFNLSERAEMIAKGWAATKKALQLDPRLPDAYAALGQMQARQAQWENAEHSFRRAIAAAPRDPLWRDYFVSSLLLPLGRIPEALAELRRAEELDSHLPLTHTLFYMALRTSGRFADADFHCRRAAENEQQMSSCWAETLLRQEKPGQAVQVLETVWHGHLLRMGAQSLGVAYAAAGRPKDAERLAALVPRPISRAIIFAALGDKDRTLEYLEQLVPTGPVRVGRTLIDPEFALLRGDPRLKVLRKKVGLPN